MLYHYRCLKVHFFEGLNANMSINILKDNVHGLYLFTFIKGYFFLKIVTLFIKGYDVSQSEKTFPLLQVSQEYINRAC